MKNLLLLLTLLGAGPACAADPRLYKWMTANEYYMVLPAAQRLGVSGAKTETVNPWGVGLRAVGNGPFSRAAGLQLQSVKVDSAAAGRGTLYLLELLLGMDYLSPKAAHPLRWRAAGMAGLGLSGETLYLSPVLSAGLLYTTDDAALSPTGFTCDLFYRFADLDLDDVGAGRAGTLKPGLGLKVGYIFQGFWELKEKN